MTTQDLKPGELGVSQWQMTYDQSILKWIVFRTYDSLDNDPETGEPLYGAGFDIYAEVDHKSEALVRMNEANQFQSGKQGYTLVTTD